MRPSEVCFALHGPRNAEFKTKNRMEHGAKGITRVFVFLLAKDLSFILEK
jgi:hypothetical protein